MGKSEHGTGSPRSWNLRLTRSVLVGRRGPCGPVHSSTTSVLGRVVNPHLLTGHPPTVGGGDEIGVRDGALGADGSLSPTGLNNLLKGRV